jgi:hypothetical protein
MKVTIEIDGRTVTTAASAAVAAQEQSEAGDADAGTGPGGEAAAAAASMDVGGPPQWLLDEVAAAESEGRSMAAADVAAAASDAGAGPSAV